MARSFWILILCVALSGCASSPVATDSAEAEVAQASDRFWATRDSRDAAALAGQFTETGILMVPGLADAVGRAEVRELLKARLASASTTDFKVHRREIEVVDGSAYELAWFSEISQRGGEALRLEGHYLLVWKREGDVWRVHRYLYNFSGMTPVPQAN